VQDPSRAIERFASVLKWRGAIALGCGIAALAFPDALLLRAMLLTGIVLAASGAYEMVFAFRNRHLNRGWPLVLADGAACFGMAVISATLTAIPFHATLSVASLWLLACGTLAFVLALALWPMRRTRIAMLAWAAAQVALAAFAAFDSAADLVTLLYVGAGYTIGFGIFQVAAAQWMRQVAVPQFEPTRQHRWLAPRAG
jgi:uncharacterized membrane protein HdeD (DUF308 family)